jgi:hypothetical protein
MRYLAALPLLLGLCSTAFANTFRLECVDTYDGKTRLALIEINTDAATIKIYSESNHDWKSAVNVSIADAAISYIDHAFNDTADAAISVTIDRVTGKYFAYMAHHPRTDGQCKKVPSDRSF